MLVPRNKQIWLYHEPVDMRKAISGLSILIAENFKKDIALNAMFVFYNKNKNIVKTLYWHYDGFCLLTKKACKNKFKVPNSLLNNFKITDRQFCKLLEGLYFINEYESKYDIFF